MYRGGSRAPSDPIAVLGRSPVFTSQWYSDHGPVGAGLPAMQAVTVRTPSRASPLPQAACAAMPTLTAAEVWVGAGLPAMQAVTVRAPSRASPLPQAACAAMSTSTGYGGLCESWLASDRVLSGAACIAGKPAPTSCLRSHAYTDRLPRSGWELACQRLGSCQATLASRASLLPQAACAATPALN